MGSEPCQTVRSISGVGVALRDSGQCLCSYLICLFSLFYLYLLILLFLFVWGRSPFNRHILHMNMMAKLRKFARHINTRRSWLAMLLWFGRNLIATWRRLCWVGYHWRVKCPSQVIEFRCMRVPAMLFCVKSKPRGCSRGCSACKLGVTQTGWIGNHWECGFEYGVCYWIWPALPIST